MQNNKKIIKIYTAGPYRSQEGFYKVQENIFRAWKTTVEINRLGAQYENLMVVALCPHTLFGNMDDSMPGQWFVDATMVVCQMCDATFIVDCTQEELDASLGTLGEIEDTEDRECPVFFSLDDLSKWLNIQNILAAGETEIKE